MSGGRAREIGGTIENPVTEESDEGCYRDEGHSFVAGEEVELCIYCGDTDQLD